MNISATLSLNSTTELNMKKEEYQVLYNLEDHYWWYLKLRELVISSLDHLYSQRNLKILDAGCGTGGMLKSLNGFDTIGLELSPEAIKFCNKRGLKNIVQGSVTNLPFPDDYFDVVISLDVLYHMDVEDDEQALQEAQRVLKDNGRLLLHLPAYNFLKSEHDVAISTKHRYTKGELSRKLKNQGFEIEKISYRNTILFPIILVARLFKKFGVKNQANISSDLKPLPKGLNYFLASILSIENRILQRTGLPFGLSLFCIARKVKK